MGLRIRKSIKLGGGAKINLSKSGIGYSVGTKGARITKKANGGTRATLSVPGTGISYVKETGGSKSSGRTRTGTSGASSQSPRNPKRKTLLWIAGWVLIFPLPLTILLLRKKDMKALLKYGIIAVAWIFYLLLLMIGGSGSDQDKAPAPTSETVSERSIIETTAPETTTAKPVIEVESLSILGETNELILGTSTQLTAELSPANADDQTISWNSGDPSIAVVDSKGLVTAASGGNTVITAESSNGITSAYEINVDGSKRLMNLRVRYPRDDENNIGDEWSFTTEINGERTTGKYTLAVGDELKFHARFTEEDDNPDIGEASETHTVTEEDLQNGFEVEMDLYVTENGGRNSGKSAHFLVIYTFTTE